MNPVGFKRVSVYPVPFVLEPIPDVLRGPQREVHQGDHLRRGSCLRRLFLRHVLQDNFPEFVKRDAVVAVGIRLREYVPLVDVSVEAQEGPVDVGVL